MCLGLTASPPCVKSFRLWFGPQQVSFALYWNISSVSLWLWKFVLGLSASVLLKLSEVVLGSSAGCVLFVIDLLSQSIWNLICCAHSNSFGGATFY